jgi:hypothetical protein
MKLEFCKMEHLFEILPAITLCKAYGTRITSISISWLMYTIQIKFWKNL